ncbi:response regulator [Spirosoma sp. HMF4905]|uniref:histidine kinase n=1 Tax=Spirosoma arboris TaxID=2682092 RepID=A0A7K1SNQ8_9BACT|nr:response regulator [Spirosoma arboris]MVM35438.1 response regulator [Spirosoma arboris]
MRFLYLLFSLFPFALSAQPTQRTATGWQELTISDGLSQGMIFDLKQDQKGFIWVATKDGLNRYDGHNFKTFTHDPYNPFSLSDNACSALLLDRHNRLWVGTLNKGLNLYDNRTQRFYHITLSDKTKADSNSYEILLLDEDPEGNIWVGTTVGISFKIQLPKSLQGGFPEQADFTRQIHLTPLYLNKGRANRPHFHYSFNENGQALTGLDNEVYTFNWHKPTSPTKLNLFPGDAPNLFDLYKDPQQDFLFVSTIRQIYGWHRGHLKVIPLPKTTIEGALIKPIDKNTLAISTASHLWLLSPSQLFSKDSLIFQDAFVAFPPDVFGVTNVLKDKSGNIWAGTRGYGLRKFNPRVKQFHSYLPKTSLSPLYVDQQGRTYARNLYAYGLVDRVTNRLVPFLDERLPEADRRQRYMIQDRKGFFWVSNVHFQTHEQHLFKFSNTWQLLKKYPLPPGITFGFWGNQTLEDPAGNLWIGATNGKLLQFNPQSETFQVFSYQAHSEMETYALLREPDGSFWIGTQQGLIKAQYLSTKPTFSYYKNSTTDRQSLSNDFVLSLANDPAEPTRYLWVGTKGGGLERLDKKTGLFEHFTEVQGLPNKVIYGILPDASGSLWLSTNRGLSQFNPKTNQFRNYTRADGLQDDEFNTSSFFKTTSGELLFGGVNGLNTFRPSELSAADHQAPMVNIIGFRVNNKPVEAGGTDGLLTQGIEYTQQLDLSHDQNLLTFEFGVMDYTNSANNRYRYRLKGIDQDWVEAGTNRFANYAQLPDGRYTLQMIGSVDGQHWSKPLELQIRVHPPFYRSWWAYLIYLLVLVLVGWQLYQFQTQRLLLQQQIAFKQQEANRLSELDALKTQFFTNISHEFRTPLTLILGPLADLKRRFPAESVLDLMERSGNRLLSLINQLLDLSKLEAGQLKTELSTGDLAAFFRTLASSFSSLAESRQIRFVFDQNESEYWADFDRDKLEKIVTNLLSNAFKFTTAGHEVRMNVHYPESQASNLLQITIEDTGIGIAKKDLAHIFERFYQRSADAVDGQSNAHTHEGTGIGLALVNELVKVLGGTSQVTSTEGVGTTFTVSLPLVAVWKETALVDLNRPFATSVNELPSQTLVDIDASVPQGMPLQVEEVESTTAISDNILLIIDDNPDIRAYVHSIFEADYQIVEAEDGQQGLDQATALTPNIVICDLMMPRLDGFGFCRALKAQEATSHIPVVMLTAKAAVEDRIEGFELGADDYLTKPFNADELRTRVRNLVRQREHLYQRFAQEQSELVTVTAVPEVSEPSLLATEQKFLDRLSAVVMQHIDDPDFTVEVLAENVNLSRTQLFRKLKALTNTTATNFILDIRMEKATQLLAEQEQTVTQIAYAVGFDNPSYFTKLFKERYGVLPSHYGKSITQTS